MSKEYMIVELNSKWVSDIITDKEAIPKCLDIITSGCQESGIEAADVSYVLFEGENLKYTNIYPLVDLPKCDFCKLSTDICGVLFCYDSPKEEGSRYICKGCLIKKENNEILCDQ
jgi:hypothetical protein